MHEPVCSCFSECVTQAVHVCSKFGLKFSVVRRLPSRFREMPFGRMLSTFLVLFSAALIAASPISAPSGNDAPEPLRRFSTGPQAAGETLVDVIAKDPELTTLLSALKAAKLVDALRGPGPFTVWAPTDEAFGRLPKGALEHLLNPANVKAVILFEPTFL